MQTRHSSAGRVAGCTAIVTGAARGIGAAIARRLAEEGAEVWLTDVDDAEGEGTASALRELGLAAQYRRMDVTAELDWASVIDAAAQSRHGLDILVNNAGIAPVIPLEGLDATAFRQVLAVNVEGPLIGLRMALPALRARATSRRGGSSVVNIASLLGKRALPGHLAYGTSKAALLQFTRCAAIELAQRGDQIRVNSVLPAVTETPMVLHEIQEWARAGTFGTHDEREARRALESRIPLGRLGHPLDIADATLFLAGSESAFMTGAELTVDGGRSAL